VRYKKLGSCSTGFHMERRADAFTQAIFGRVDLTPCALSCLMTVIPLRRLS
jgi:hypothetical protein